VNLHSIIKLVIIAFALDALIIGALEGLDRSKTSSPFLEYTIKGIEGVASADLSPDGRQVAIRWGMPAGETANHIPKGQPAILFWDSDRREIAATRAYGEPRTSVFDPNRPIVLWESFVRYSPDGHFLLAFEDRNHLDLLRLRGTDIEPLQRIDLDLSPERPTLAPVDLVSSPDNRHVAVLLSWEAFHEGLVRVYGLGSGKVSWERAFDRVEMAHAAWSPDGRRLAVTLLTGRQNSAYPPRDIPNLLILDADSGYTLLSVNTGDQAGPVCFAPNNQVLTAPVHLEPRGHGPLDTEKVKVWDGSTGALIRQIGDRKRDIHNQLALSVNGSELVAYVGKEKSGVSLRALEYVAELVDQRFEVFDYKTGRATILSPDLRTAHSGCNQDTPSIRLSSKGDRILLYWPNRGCSAKVLELVATSSLL
jgi:hypothetical protein